MISIEKLTDKQINKQQITSWPIWEKEVSTFPWEYDTGEFRFLFEGEVMIKADDREFFLQKADFVKFPKGWKCQWYMLKDIRKYDQFA